MKNAVLFILFFTLLYSCNDKPYSPPYITGHFPDGPVNFLDINSEFDDYNATLPYIESNSLLLFSSNRNSQGLDFDIVGKGLYIKWDQKEGVFSIEQASTIHWSENISAMADSVNSVLDEFGPYAFSYRLDQTNAEFYKIDLLMYSSNVDGDFDINFIYTSYLRGPENEIIVSSIQKTGFLDLSANEQYPSFYGPDFYFLDEFGTDPAKIVSMMYCSDKDGTYDIYKVDITIDNDFITTLVSTDTLEPSKLNISSTADDKCPYVNGNLLVFTSNRPGGSGGYDLYFSRFENNQWTAPVNFGEGINTEYDEYRPITIFQKGYDNNLMIFSSNRPEGKGGFDLYYAGIDQMIE